MTDDLRTFEIKYRVTAEEREQIQQNAAACKKTVAAYSRDTALNMFPLVIDHRIVREHSDILSGYRNVIVQLIYTIRSSGSYAPADLEYILDRTNSMLKSENKFLAAYNAHMELIRKNILRTVRKVVREKIGD